MSTLEIQPSVRIGLIGDYSKEVRAHKAISKSLELASGVMSITVAPSWLPTTLLNELTDKELESYDGLWCVPGSPYQNMDAALQAIEFARVMQHPFLATCGGFQHVLIEYARDVLGIMDADHAESNPQTLIPIVSPLSCSLVGAKGTIKLLANSLTRAIYGRDEIVEQYHCSYGLNPAHQSLFDGMNMKITGVDENGEVRIVELAGHPFFFATLYQPELSAFDGVVHPLITAFVRAAAAFKASR